MKLIALLLAFSSVVSWGSGTRWITVHLPTHVLYIDEGAPGGITEVPCVTSSSSTFERTIALMNAPYVPHHTNWNVRADTNLITLYRITILGVLDLESDPKDPKLIITIDCSNSVVPDGYNFSLDEVVEKVRQCVTLNLNPEEIKVIPKEEKKENKAEMATPRKPSD